MFTMKDTMIERFAALVRVAPIPGRRSAFREGIGCGVTAPFREVRRG
jgi:hypothetical protein